MYLDVSYTMLQKVNRYIVKYHKHDGLYTSKSNWIMTSIANAKLNAVCLTAYFVQFSKLLVEWLIL